MQSSCCPVCPLRHLVGHSEILEAKGAPFGQTQQGSSHVLSQDGSASCRVCSKMPLNPGGRGCLCLPLVGFPEAAVGNRLLEWMPPWFDPVGLSQHADSSLQRSGVQISRRLSKR